MNCVLAASLDKTISITDAEERVPLKKLEGHHSKVGEARERACAYACVCVFVCGFVRACMCDRALPAVEAPTTHPHHTYAHACWVSHRCHEQAPRPHAAAAAACHPPHSPYCCKPVHARSPPTIPRLRPRTRPPTQGVSCLDWSPIYKFVASGSLDRRIVLWNPFSQKPLAVLAGHNAAVTQVLVNDRDNQIISLSTDRTVKVGRLRRRARASACVGLCAWQLAVRGRGISLAGRPWGQGPCTGSGWLAGLCMRVSLIEVEVVHVVGQPPTEPEGPSVRNVRPGRRLDMCV